MSITELPTTEPQRQLAPPSLILVMLISAMAGGMGWGIRGQYGHETGAMIAGALVGLVLTFFFCPTVNSLFTARAVAFMTVAIGFGGSMTYGQTVGLTHDAELIGNKEALQWGFLGLFIKGGIWIAFAGAFLGIGLSRVKWRPTEIASMLVAMVFFLFLGLFLINQPFDPANRELPNVYFSDQWFWEPDKADLKPRFERWGGLFLALVSVVCYAAFIKRDKLAQWLALFGFLAGGFGFSLGQGVQAYHAWNPEVFQTGWLSGGVMGTIFSKFNWWNMMETTFGAIFGAILALGVWLNRGLIQTEPEDESVELSAGNEWMLIGVHIVALITWNFYGYQAFDMFADHAITMGLLPIFGIVAGRFWPYLLALPIVILPIAGKTIRHLVFDNPKMDQLLAVLAYPLNKLSPDTHTSVVQFVSETPARLAALGWIVYGVIPVGLALLIALRQVKAARTGQTGRSFARWALLFSAWVYFCLNFGFFEFSWPWAPLEEWTGRTPNATLFAISLLGITLVTLCYGWRPPRYLAPAVPADSPPTTEPIVDETPAPSEGPIRATVG